MPPTLIITSDVNPAHLAKVVAASFVHYNITNSFFSVL